MDRQMIRDTAGRVLRSDDLAANELEAVAAFLRANPAMGNPHVVRCDWCHQTQVLFPDEEKDAFKRSGRGWRCTTCDNHAAWQEVRF